MIHYLSYLLIRLIGLLISPLSYKNIFRLGKIFGSIAFFCHHTFRKKAMTSLAIAYGTTLTEEERRSLAKRSFQNLMITCLEFFRLKRSQYKMEEIVQLKKNPEVEALLDSGQGVIFLSAHQANWEIPFLALTQKWRGVAIGRPINNPYLYKYVMSIREMHQGTIIMPKEATKKGIQALKEGAFLGIVGDQAYPESSYTYPLLGTRAYTAATPALLAYRTQCPIVVGSCRRIKGHYIISGSKPIWPDLSKPLREEMPRMMDQAMKLMESSIQQYPQQWMWIHERYKQQGINQIKREYRYSFLLVILPPQFQDYLEVLSTIQKLYPRAFITLFLPQGGLKELTLAPEITPYEYTKESDLFVRDWRIQMVFDFYDSKKLRKHYKKLGAFVTLHVNEMRKKDPSSSLPILLKNRIVKRECLKTVSI